MPTWDLAEDFDAPQSEEGVVHDDFSGHPGGGTLSMGYHEVYRYGSRGRLVGLVAEAR